MENLEELRQLTAQYAIEHVTGKGLHTGFAWLRDSFNELCEAMHANNFNPDDLEFNLEELVDNLKKEPWVVKIAAKPVDQRDTADIDRLVNGFICKHWLIQPKEVNSKHVADVLRVADPYSHRILVAQSVVIDCIRELNGVQLERLDQVMGELALNPNFGRGHDIRRV